MINNDIKEYNIHEIVSFLDVKSRFGGLSNMDGTNFPLEINGNRIRSSEALYQACRFPHLPEVQKEIIDQKSPMAAKMKSKPFRKEHSRIDFEQIKVDLMYWCLRVKLACNPLKFGMLLDSTKDLPIVEISKKDDFWGAKSDINNSEILRGQNVLGQLLCELRDFYRANKNTTRILKVPPLEIPNFKLFDKDISEVVNSELRKTKGDT